MKKFVLASALFLGLGFSQVMFAANEDKNASGTSAQQSTRIGVIDIKQIIDSAPQIKALNEKMKSKFEGRRQKIEADQKAFEQEALQFKRDAAVMTQKQKEAAAEKLENKRRDLIRTEQDFQQDYIKTRTQENNEFYDMLIKIVGQFAAENNYDVIIPKNAVPYASTRIDVTTPILEKVKEKAQSKS